MPRPPRNKTVHFHAQIPRSHHALMRDTPLVRDIFVTMGGYGRDIQHPFENPYQARLKAQAAAQQLLDHDRGVAEVAQAMGFEDPLYFSRWFRKLMGSAPSKFREQTRLIR